MLESLARELYLDRCWLGTREVGQINRLVVIGSINVSNISMRQIEKLCNISVLRFKCTCALQSIKFNFENMPPSPPTDRNIEGERLKMYSKH